METFGTWILKQLDNRGWTQAELARRAQIGEGTLSRIISDTHKAGPSVCLALAQAFREPPEKVYRLAGLLPPRPPAFETEEEIIDILRALPNASRHLALNLLRTLAATSTDQLSLSFKLSPKQSAAVSEPQTTYLTNPDLQDELLHEFDKLPDHWQQEAIEEVKRLQHLSTLTIRFVGEEEDDQKERQTENL